MRNLGLSIAQNANSVECLRLQARPGHSGDVFFKKLFSLDVWKEAFPSLQRAYFTGNVSALIHVSQYLMKHVRHLYKWHQDYREKLPQRYMDWIGNMIRNNVIEEVEFRDKLLDDDTLLDDTLRSVRSFHVEIARSTSLRHLARSFERTKAEGDKLERLSVRWLYNTFSSFSATALDSILRSRPQLQVLEVKTMYASDWRDVVALFQAVASSTLTTFTCNRCDMRYATVEAAVALLCDLLQHSTIRVLELIVDFSENTSDHDNDFVQGIAEGLRATRLRRFHLTLFSPRRVSIGSMTKLYESVRENRSLMDIQLKGNFWQPWRMPHYSLPDVPPCPFSFFEFLSSRNHYLSQLVMSYEHTLPAGLWPLILEYASCDASTLLSLLLVELPAPYCKVED